MAHVREKTHTRIKLQPVVLLLDSRLDCECGNAAISVTGSIVENSDGHTSLQEAVGWCQDCLDEEQ